MPYTLVMAKPDAMRRPDVLAAIDEQIATASVARRYAVDTALTEEQARTLFPSFDEVRYPLTRALLLCYLTSGPVRFVVLSGSNALGAGRQIRRSVRNRFAVAALANCVHAAADPEEAARQLGWLSATHGTPPHWSGDTGSGSAAAGVTPVPGITGRLAAVDLGRLARSVWSVLERVGWGGLWQAPAAPGQWVTRLCSDDAHSLDYAAATLYEVHPDLSPVRAVQAVLRVDQTGSAIVHAGSRTAATELASALAHRGLTAAADPVT
ncbi:ATP-dependent Clp protease adaptor ClpS [Krasilnikovia sp. MM14-A1259]|uniref:ATP-dependent Clp protease adaptor ClpS n=1 Tax=Krasilnikovia sp. MM14-A1259 TaxID=3373539 RepID=UPI0037FFECA3